MLNALVGQTGYMQDCELRTGGASVCCRDVSYLGVFFVRAGDINQKDIRHLNVYMLITSCSRRRGIKDVQD